MVIRIVTSVSLGNHNFVIGQEYEYHGTVRRYTGCDPCDLNKYSSGRGYVTDINGSSIVIPAEHAALINKNVPDTDMRGLWQRHRDAATQDYVVFDGDYVKAAKEKLNINIKPKERADQADYNWRRIRRALRITQQLIDGTFEFEDGLELEDTPPFTPSPQGIGFMTIGTTFIITQGGATGDGIGNMQIGTTFKIQ